MKTRASNFSFLIITAAISLLPTAVVFAADDAPASSAAAPSTPAVTTSTPSTAPVATVAVTTAAPSKLPYGVEDVVKLTQAQVNEDIILNYVQNSGTIYNLGPQDLVYLKNTGVSDKVVYAMLENRKRATDMAAAAQAQVTAAAQQPGPDNSAAPAEQAPTETGVAPDYAAGGAPVDSQTGASSVYVIPYNSGGYYYGYPYTYYGPSFGVYFYGGHYHYGHYGYYGHGHSVAHGGGVHVSHHR
jgi:hypothetical protein